MRALLAGESWVTHSVHVKGVDSFDTSTYVEGAGRLIEALGKAGLEVDYLPAHLVPARFPATAADLAAYGAVILKDIGANSLLLAPDTFERSTVASNRLASVEQYARDGGGLLMIGGYLSFAGIEGKARYHHTRSKPPSRSPSARMTTGTYAPRARTPPSSSQATPSWTAFPKTGHPCSATTA